MERCLIIDDLRIFGPYDKGIVDVVYARTSEEALEILAEDRLWTAIFFDHDLGGMDDTMPVVRFVVENSEDFKGTDFFVHTANPVGAQNIHSYLTGAGLEAYRISALDYFNGSLDWV